MRMTQKVDAVFEGCGVKDIDLVVTDLGMSFKFTVLMEVFFCTVIRRQRSLKFP